MKTKPFFIPVVVGISFVSLTACSTSQQPPQTPVQLTTPRTQQGVDVGLKIYNPNSQQSNSAANVPEIMSPDLSKPVSSPLEIHGKVSGLFFSEGVFPVVLKDESGKELVRTLAHADGEWMTEDSVPFTAILKFTPPASKKAVLVLQKDNPSGLQNNENHQEFQLIFK